MRIELYKKEKPREVGDHTSEQRKSPDLLASKTGDHGCTDSKRKKPGVLKWGKRGKSSSKRGVEKVFAKGCDRFQVVVELYVRLLLKGNPQMGENLAPKGVGLVPESILYFEPARWVFRCVKSDSGQTYGEAWSS